MLLAVCVKYVPDASGPRRLGPDGTVDRVGSEGRLCELDEYAIEEALAIRDASGDGEVVVVTVGPEQARAAVLKSLQMGADTGVHVVDEAIHGSDSVGTSRVLAAVIERRRPDIVVCGMASTDGSMGVVPAMLAERLGLPQLTFASEVTLDGRTVRIRRDGDAAVEIVEATLPVLLSVTDQCNEPRYPSFKQIMAAKRKPVETLTLADLGIEVHEVGLEAAWTAVQGSAERPPRGAGTVVTDADGSGADALVEFLVGQKLI
jgi:electron transfer flavoprotein beta subunit